MPYGSKPKKSKTGTVKKAVKMPKLKKKPTKRMKY